MREKTTQINGLSINYKIVGAGKTPVVLLHGWGLSSEKYVVTAENILEKDSGYVFYIPDLPGFGKSEEPKESWRLDDYVDFAKEFFKNVAQRDGGFEPLGDILEKAVKDGESSFKIENKKVILIGHSFGGRIAIKYTKKYPEDIEKLILTGAAGIKHRLTARQEIFYRLSKTGKKIFRLPILSSAEKYARQLLYKLLREKDYISASACMKEIMKNALDEDLTGNLEQIEIATVLIWGKNDRSTPLEDGRLMDKKIANSKLFIIEEANHSVPYNNAEEFAKVFILEAAPLSHPSVRGQRMSQ